jgi:hypothetical protein
VLWYLARSGIRDHIADGCSSLLSCDSPCLVAERGSVVG